MSIRFGQEDWARIRQSHEAWWRGELERPLIHCKVKDRFERQRPKPCAPVLSQANCHDFSYSPEAVIDALDYELSGTEFLGDSYPGVNFNCFGPGVAAAFSGARLDNSSGSVWFFPPEEKSAEEISIRYDPENVWVQRIKALYRAGGERWQGNVLMSMPDLGGVMDIVATFVGSENLLYALIDQPDEVKRLVGEAHEAFNAAYNDLSGVLREIGNPGYSDWDNLYSKEPSYILQSDFSYMIGPEMFREFVLEDLKKHCAELTHTVYHTDGIGQLNHLGYLLEMDRLNAVQWVPGSGKPTGRVWMDVYRRISEAGKGFEIIGSCRDCLDVLEELQRGVYYQAGFDDRDAAAAFLKAAGVP